MTWFAANRQGALPPFDKGVPFVHGRRDPAPARMGRYLLESEETPRLWAEVFGFRRRFVTYEIVLGGPTWEAAFEAPLATLVGAVALNAHADLLILAPASDTIEDALQGLAWGDRRRVLTLDHTHRLVGGRYVNLRAIDPLAWWETTEGKAARQRLAYLEKRLERRPAFGETRRRSFLERLFGVGRPKK